MVIVWALVYDVPDDGFVMETVGGVTSGHTGVVALDAELCALWLPALSTADTVYE